MDCMYTKSKFCHAGSLAFYSKSEFIQGDFSDEQATRHDL